MATPQQRMRSLWRRLGSRAAGRRAFSRLLGSMIPYTGSIRPVVRELEAGAAVVTMRDRRRTRNHLGSIHAVALANLAEAASGLALNYGLPEGMRAILVRLEIDYLKKARGTISARARSAVPVVEDGTHDVSVPVELTDESGEVVVRGRAHWRVGPIERSEPPENAADGAP